MELSQQKTNYMVDGFNISNNPDNEEIIYIPYNINNILVTEDNIKDILSSNNVIVDKINHINFFIQSFTHKSYIQKDIFPQNILEASKKEIGNPKKLLELQKSSYERLEYLGDRVVKLITSMYLFYRYPEEDEGFMTRLQTKIEDKTNLAAMSRKIGLGKYFIISQQIEGLNGRNLEKIHEDVFEAFLGALYLSNGFEPCCMLMINLLETMIDYSDKLYRDNNYKDIILRYYHKNKWIFPKYHMIYQEGPPHKRTYIMGVEKGSETPLETNNPRENCVGFGIGNSKKEGQQNAAKMALILYGSLNNDQYENSDIFYPDWEKIDSCLANESENYLINTDSNESSIVDKHVVKKSSSKKSSNKKSSNKKSSNKKSSNKKSSNKKSSNKKSSNKKKSFEDDFDIDDLQKLELDNMVDDNCEDISDISDETDSDNE
jgi:ribonuclease III